ncbi:CHAT domain-containing protein [Coprinopsis sp. MPI-PUGE-AT-0042]|nr:CHAT domain-containing protein [Coprinopsis sp. MPI-PUGE-AT-0042]
METPSTTAGMLRLTNFSLEHMLGDGERHEDFGAFRLVFTARGPSQVLFLSLSSPNHWAVEADAHLCLPAQMEALVVILQDEDCGDIATITLSREELFKDALSNERGVHGASQRVEMKDLSLYNETGRWILSWQIDMVEMDACSPPTSVQRDAEPEAVLETSAAVDEIPLLKLVQPNSENEEQFCLTGITVIYTPEDKGLKTANVDVAKIFFLSRDQDWALQLTASSANCWEVVGDASIVIPKETESLTVSLQDNDLEDVAVTFVTHDQVFGDWTKASKHDGTADGCSSRVEMSSLLDSVGGWHVAWRIQRCNAKKAKDDDLATRWRDIEALFQWQTAGQRAPHQFDDAMAAFRVVAQAFSTDGSDIILQQARAMFHKIRSKNTNDVSAIEEAIEIQTLLVVNPRVQQSRQMHAIATSHLAAMHHERFNKTMLPEHLDYALSLYQAAVQLSRPQSDIHSDCLHRLAQGYHTHFQRTSNLHDSVKAITNLSEACEFGKHDPSILKANLSLLLPWLQEYLGHLPRNHPSNPLASALSSLLRVLKLVPKDPTHPLFQKTRLLAAFIGLVLVARYSVTQALEDLNNVISHHRFFVPLYRHNPSFPTLPQVLHELFHLLKDRMMKAKEPTDEDRDEAILVGREVLALVPTPLDEDNISLLAGLHFQRYQTLQLASDLEDSIHIQRRLADSMSSDHPSYADAFDDLVRYLCTRGVASKMESDIDEALAIASKGLALTHRDKDQYPIFKRCQVFALHQKFRLTGNINHLDTATSILLQSQCSTSSRSQGDLLTELMGSYWALHTTSPDAGYYLHKIIACAYKHVEISNTPKAYHQLGVGLKTLYSISQSKRDIESATEALSTSVQMSEAAGDDPSPRLLLDLSDTLISNPSRGQVMSRLTEARKHILRALSNSQEHEDIHHEALVGLIRNTVRQFNCRFCSQGSGYLKGVETDWLAFDSELTQSLAEMEGLISRIPTLSPNYPQGRILLVTISMMRRGISADHQHMEDLIERAKEFHRDDPEHLGGLLSTMYELSSAITGNPRDCTLALQEYRKEALDVQKPVLVRFNGARSWVELCRLHNVEQSLEAYGVAIGLLAMTAGLGGRVSEGHRHVAETAAEERFSGDERFSCGPTLPLAAAARAVQCDRMDKALEWLEEGRCLVWNRLQNLRTPFDSLGKYNSQLAKRMWDVSKLLEDSSTEHAPLGEGVDHNSYAKITLAEDSATRARASKEWDELLNKAREIPGFEDFLRPTRCSTLLQNLPESGPVVVLNAHESRCDAIVLLSGFDEPLLVPLSQMLYSRAKAMQEELKVEVVAERLRMREVLQDELEEQDTAKGEDDGSNERGFKRREAPHRRDISTTEAILRELWEVVVKPILDALALATKSATPSTRIWWCPTGPFSFLPIHAAGIYGQGASSECLADYAVSSYTPTVSALTARVKKKRDCKAGDPRLLLVSVPEAMGKAPIFGTTTEVRALRDLATTNGIDHLGLEGEEATAESVMEEIAQSSIVHLACHGSQNGAEPMRSCFSLQDKDLDLSTIIKANLKNADLAFLSACQTGTGDESLSNEAVHLAAGMLAAGFRGTVATMIFLRGEGRGGGGIDAEDAAFGLHYATQELKKRLGGAEKSFLAWVPYVHYGL